MNGPNLPTRFSIGLPHFSHDLADLDALLEIDHFLAGAREILLELLVERGERLHVVGLALLDLVEIVLEAARVLDVDDVVEALGEQIADHQAERGRLEPAFDLVDVVAILQHADDRRVRARAADAVFLELLDERRFREPRRRLRELLLGPERLQLQRLALGERRQHARRAFVVVALRRPGSRPPSALSVQARLASDRRSPSSPANFGTVPFARNT